jgi:hypothetical protein
MKRSLLTYGILTSLFLLSMGVRPASGMRVVFLERLANFEGIVPSIWSRVAVEKGRNEVITLEPRERRIRIFDEHGMEIFSLGDNIELSGATDIDVGEDGDIFVVYPRGEEHKILRLDYKGELLGPIDLKNFPEDFQSLNPSQVQYKDGMLYLADTAAMDVVVTDTNGLFQKGYHLNAAVRKLEEDFKGRPGGEEFATAERFAMVDMFGFWVDPEGNIFFTVPLLFTVFKLPVDGEMRLFGTAGGARGKFGVIAGITTDRQGNIYVTDRLRSVVAIYDKSFNFLTEFGLRGFLPGSLVVPDDLVINNEQDLIYVAQAANRGVSVFRIVED